MRRLAACLLALLVAAAPVQAFAPSPGAYGPEGPRLREQFWLVPSPDPGILLRTSVFRPAGDGPFPLVVLGHGSQSHPEERIRLPLAMLWQMTEFFVAQGYVVALPERRGHGGTGGPYAEHNNPCRDPDFVRSGLETARDLAATIMFMRGQPFVADVPAIVAGQSAGGFGGLALASTDTRLVAGIINFAGGRGGRSERKANNNCAPQKLIAAAGTYGKTARTIPTLWIYAENDTFFAPWIARGMAEAYATAGGKVEFHMLPPFRDEGHVLAIHPDGRRLWTPLVRQFLEKLR
jgi:dienelactone hydrolase